MNILVTGGAGFVGSSLIKRLASKNHSIISVDNYTSGSEMNHVAGVTYIRDDVRNLNNINFEPLDVIFHFGEYSRVEQSFENFEKCVDFNLSGITEVIKLWRKHNAKLIYSGSSTKFGSGDDSKSPYSISKSSNTELVKNMGELFMLNYAITYFYNVFGENENGSNEYGTVVQRFLEAKRLGKKAFVTAPGTQQRNFTHIDDIVSGLLLVMSDGNGDEFGIGSERSYSIIELANLIDVEFELTQPRRGNRKAATLKTAKTEQLGWRAERSLEEYIKNATKD